MKTSNEIESNFRKDLEELLLKYKAEMDITDDGRPYGMHSGIVRMSISGEWDKDGNVVSEYTEFIL